MGSNRGYVPRGIHWNSKEGKAIVARIRLGSRVDIPFAGNRAHCPSTDAETQIHIEVWFRNRGSDLVHRYQSSAVYSECGVAGFFTGTKPLSELLEMQDNGRKPRYRFCADCAVWGEQW